MMVFSKSKNGQHSVMDVHSGTSMYIDSSVTFGDFIVIVFPLTDTTSYFPLPVHLPSHRT